MGIGRQTSVREIEQSSSGTTVRIRNFSFPAVTKDSMAGNQHWFFDPAYNGWLWYGPDGLWIRYPLFPQQVDSSRNLFLKWPCQKGDIYNTKYMGLDVNATVDAVDSVITVPAFTDTCCVVTFRYSGNIMLKMFFSPGTGWMREDDYFTYSMMDGSAFLPLVSYPHFRYEVTAYKAPDGVRELISGIPLNYNLLQNYPNPFNPTTVIRYQLPVASTVSLTIYDLLGREVATLVNERQQAGWKEVQWNASTFSSGIYFCRLTAGNCIETKKMLLLR
jgi:hypothetical protein